MTSDDPIQSGTVTASYFWDDGSGTNGDTGAPASGEPMQKGLFASPSWPLGTEGYVEYNGKKADFFVGDRGPGDPAQNCDVLLDIDGETFAELTGESFDTESYTVSGGDGHIEVEYHITEWGDGDGNEGAPHAMGDEGNRCEEAVSEPSGESEQRDDQEQDEAAAEAQQQREEQQQKLADLGERQDAAERKEQELQDRQQEIDTGGDGGGRGTQAETATSDMSGIELAGNDAPLAAGVLTLAALPAVIVALLFAKWRPAPERKRAATGTPGNGRHRKARTSPVGHLRRLLPGSTG
ncbi:hypothetical protein F4561_003406 [Lipingzhangella halophila]|uniref:Uncharacterized protein n=1 Tax=Lipingzhangella halophila TaxID=1783352 RepID=A0A7W7RIE1_9ACTN|nr:hypothetical protein [Lipingzhangella halophila]MBB4932586.1 hypothetical protein [Lipingzhangella halophila]